MLQKNDQLLLVKLAAESVKHGLISGSSIPVDTQKFSSDLQKLGASFVTLNINKQLRGCIGCLQAYRPLVEDVVENAFAAAFSDPRFPAVTEAEYPVLQYHISILGDAKAMNVSSEQDLIQQLQPGVDGLIIEDGTHRATFLPSVWEQLEKPEDFVRHLKQKAGLSADHWSSSFIAKRYSVEDFGT